MALDDERKATILIVEDSAVIRVLVRAYLRDSGYLVREAEDGQEGLEACLASAPDLVLLDIVMPRIDGFSLCARLQNNPDLSHVPIIMLSARDDSESKIRSFELGAVDYITKPVNRGELLARIQTHLTISSLTRSLQDANRDLLYHQQQLLEGLYAAADLQKSLLPKRVPDCKGLQFVSYFNPCQEVGGDIYNIQRLDSNHLACYILDVSGHGFPAAMMTALVTQAMSGKPSTVPTKDGVDRRARTISPGRVLSELNDEFPLERFNLYFTIIYILFNTTDFSFRYCCAGHPPLVQLSASGKLDLLDTGGPPVGMDGAWEEGSGRLEPGDRLFLYTDGFTEYCDATDEMYGQQRLVGSVENSRSLSLQAAVQDIIADVKQFGGGEEVDGDDDMTLLAIERQ
jgi:sigma-B regulation protein RsbU (phosphoserine phosphatase)